MTTIPEQRKYARRSRKHDEIICWRRHCGFRFGEVRGGRLAYVDGGFTQTPEQDLADDAITIRRSDYPATIPMRGLTLDAEAEKGFRDAKRQRKMHEFRAKGRHGKEPQLILDETEIACPACRDRLGWEEWQTISPDRLGVVSRVTLRATIQAAGKVATDAIGSHREDR